uniref:Uncharacterized protein n=1 Tax=Arundo donax TaxID=35708 RepID=A0A0A9H1A8_ARUDO
MLGKYCSQPHVFASVQYNMTIRDSMESVMNNSLHAMKLLSLNLYFFSVGGTIPATAQLASSSYHAAMSSPSFARSASRATMPSPSFAPSAPHDDMHKRRSSSPL